MLTSEAQNSSSQISIFRVRTTLTTLHLPNLFPSSMFNGDRVAATPLRLCSRHAALQLPRGAILPPPIPNSARATVFSRPVAEEAADDCPAPSGVGGHLSAPGKPLAGPGSATGHAGSRPLTQQDESNASNVTTPRDSVPRKQDDELRVCTRVSLVGHSPPRGRVHSEPRRESRCALSSYAPLEEPRQVRPLPAKPIATWLSTQAWSRQI